MVRHAPIVPLPIRLVRTIVTAGRRTIVHVSGRAGIVVGLLDRRYFCAVAVVVQAATSGKPQHKTNNGIIRRSRGACANDLSPRRPASGGERIPLGWDTCREQFTGQAGR